MHITTTNEIIREWGALSCAQVLPSAQVEDRPIVSSHHSIYEGNKSWELEVKLWNLNTF
jgi:hypothetical protein